MQEYDENSDNKIGTDLDLEEFSLLISKHHTALKNYLGTFCSNSADIEDICQESYRKAFQAISSYNPQYPFKTWLFTIAKNSALDMLRKKNCIQTVKLVESDEPLSENSQIEISPEENMIDAQKYDAFMTAIASLPPLYKRVAELRILHEYTYEDIAKELNLPLNTVRTRIRRAKQIINDTIKES